METMGLYVSRSRLDYVGLELDLEAYLKFIELTILILVNICTLPLRSVLTSRTKKSKANHENLNFILL